MINETKQLIKTWGKTCPALLSLGYRNIIKYLDNEIEYKELEKSIIDHISTWVHLLFPGKWLYPG